MIKRLILFFVIIVATLNADTQVSVSTSGMLGTIGDRFKITVRVITDADIDIVEVDYGKGDYEAVGRNKKKPVIKGNFRVYEIVDEIVFFKTGDFSVGPGNVCLKKGERIVEEKKTNSLSIKIKTTLNEKDKDIRQIMSPEEIEGNPKHLLIYVISVLAGVLVILLIMYFVMRYRKNKRTTADIKIQPPLEEFKARLKNLQRKKLIEKGMIKEYHLAFSTVVKDFLFRFYGFNALDYTTFEIMESLRQSENNNIVVDKFLNLFNQSDLIKFAKMVPEDKQIEEFYKDIDSLLESLAQLLIDRSVEVEDVSAG